MNIKVRSSLIALIILALAVVVYSSWGKRGQFTIAGTCTIGGPNIFPIESSRDLANATKAFSILMKVQDDMQFRQSPEFCIKKIQNTQDGMLDCYITKNAEYEEYIKICFAPRGALFSLEFQE